MKTSESIKSLSEALAKAQGEIGGIKKEAANDFFNSKFADLDGVREAIRPILAKYGISIVQEISYSDTAVKHEWDLPIFDKQGLTDKRDKGSVFVQSSHMLSARIFHSSGEWIEFDPLRVPYADPNDPQKVKSGITYMRRTQLLSILNLAETDDDGNGATVRGSQNIPNYAPRPVSEIKPGPLTMPFGKTKGTKLSDLPREEIESAIAWAKSKNKFLDWAAEASVFITEGGGKSDLPPPPEWGPMPDADQIPF